MDFAALFATEEARFAGVAYAASQLTGTQTIMIGGS